MVAYPFGKAVQEDDVELQKVIDNRVNFILPQALHLGQIDTLEWLSDFAEITVNIDGRGINSRYDDVVEAFKNAGYVNNGSYDTTLVDETSDMVARRIVSNAMHMMHNYTSPNELIVAWLPLYKERFDLENQSSEFDAFTK